jgi:hypothetical protein
VCLAALNQILRNDFLVLRSVNARFILAECIPATCDFNLTRLNNVDYSLSGIVQKCWPREQSQNIGLWKPWQGSWLVPISRSPLEVEIIEPENAHRLCLKK